MKSSIIILKEYVPTDFSLKLDYVDIFPKSKLEHDQLLEELKSLGKPVFETSTGTTYLLNKSIQTEKGDLQLLRVRDYDAARTIFRGHPDYKVENFSKLKKDLLSKKNVNLIKRPDYEMIEIWDQKYDVSVYFPSVALSDDIKNN